MPFHQSIFFVLYKADSVLNPTLTTLSSDPATTSNAAATPITQSAGNSRKTAAPQPPIQRFVSTKKVQKNVYMIVYLFGKENDLSNVALQMF